MCWHQANTVLEEHHRAEELPHGYQCLPPSSENKVGELKKLKYKDPFFPVFQEKKSYKVNYRVVKEVFGQYSQVPGVIFGFVQCNAQSWIH